MKTSDAERMGYGVKAVEQPPAQKESKPAPPPEINVSVDNSGLAEAIAGLKDAVSNEGLAETLEKFVEKMKPQIISERPDDGEAIVDAVKEAIAENKPEPGKHVVSCDMEHEYDSLTNAPLKTHIVFNYD
jgi:hypothetical protein